MKLPDIKPGMLVFVKSDKSKSKARDSYAVLSVNKEKKEARLQKFPLDNFMRHVITVQLQNIYIASKIQQQIPNIETMSDTEEEQTRELPIRRKKTSVTWKKPPPPSLAQQTSDSSSEAESDQETDQRRDPEPAEHQEIPAQPPTPLRRPGRDPGRLWTDNSGAEAGLPEQARPESLTSSPPLHLSGSADQAQQGGPLHQVNTEFGQITTNATFLVVKPEEHPFPATSTQHALPGPSLAPPSNSAEGELLEQARPECTPSSPPMQPTGSADQAWQGGPQLQVNQEIDDDFSDLIPCMNSTLLDISSCQEPPPHKSMSMVQTEQEPQNKSQSSVETVSSDRDENYENFPVEDIEEEEEQSQPEYYTLKQPRAKQAGGLKAGEKVLYYSRSSRAWEKVTLTNRYGGEEYYKSGSYKWSFTALDKSNPRRGYFFPTTSHNTFRWGVLRGPDVEQDFSKCNFLYPHAIDPEETEILDSTQNKETTFLVSDCTKTKKPELFNVLSQLDLEVTESQKCSLLRSKSYPEDAISKEKPQVEPNPFLLGLPPDSVYQSILRGPPIPNMVPPLLGGPIVPGRGTWVIFPSGHKAWLSAEQLASALLSNTCDISE